MRISDWSSDVCSSDLPFQKCRLHELGERGCHERSGGRYERRRIEVAVWTFIMSKHVGPTATDSDLNSLDGIKNDQPQALPLSRTAPHQENYKHTDDSPAAQAGPAPRPLSRSIVARQSIIFITSTDPHTPCPTLPP